MRKLQAALAVVIALGASTSAQAAVHVVNNTIDANEIAATGVSSVQWLASPLVLAVGDELQLNVDFLPGHTLHMVNPLALWAVIDMENEGDPHETTFDQSLSFVGLGGSGQDVAASSSNTGGWGIVAAFTPGQFMTGPLPATISFTGLRFNVVVTGYADGVTERTYDSNYLAALGAKVSVSTVSAIPEPSTAALFGLSLLGVAFAARRRLSPP